MVLVIELLIDKSSGRADAFVPPNDRTGFSEYQFSVNDIDQFEGFAIKIVLSTNNEATPVKLKDFRAIASIIMEIPKEDLVPVEGHINLFRDKETGAIVNTDTSGYSNYRGNETKKADRTGRT